VDSPEDIPKLRLVPPEPAEALGHRLEREQRAAHLQREDLLSTSLAPFRVGSVPYLNAVPLTRGLEEQVLFAPPSRLAEMLERDELDAALVSVPAVLTCDRYEVLDGIAIASLGEVQSVFLAHRSPLEDLTEVHCDGASLSGRMLLEVLLAERGIRPRFRPLVRAPGVPLPDATLLIGDPALDFLLAPHEHQIWDLGAAWFEMTNLPFVFAVWALQRGRENAALRRALREARAFGMDTLEAIIQGRTEYTYDFRKDYLGWHIHYHLGSDERRGLERFSDLLRRHRLGPVYPIRFVV
jgi:chorismate dehydratase